MKNSLFFLLLVLFFTPIVYAQQVKESQVPEAVRAVAKEQNKGKAISMCMWTLSKTDGTYSASFIDPADMRMIKITPEGKWINTRNGIRPEDIPESVMKSAKAAAKETFGKRYTLFNYFYVTGPSEEPFYSIDASPKNETKFMSFAFDSSGKRLTKP